MKLSWKDFFNIPMKQRNGIYEIENVGTEYWVNGKSHRDDGPAIDYLDGTKYWLNNNEYHRIDGPAIETINGCNSYYIKGKLFYSKKDFDKVAYLYLNGLQDYL